MKPYTPMEIDLLESAAHGACVADAEDSCVPFTPAEDVVLVDLQRRGLITTRICARCFGLAVLYGFNHDDDLQHPYITANGRLALRLAIATRSVVT